MITLYRRGRVFWAESNFSGERRRWSLKTRDRQVAQQLLHAAQLDILGKGRLTPKLCSAFQTEFLASVKPHVRESTLHEYARVLGRFLQFLEARQMTTLVDITSAVVTSYTDSRRRDVHRINRRPVTEGGIKYELRILHRAFNHAVDCGYLDRNPVRARNLNSVAGRTQPFSRNDIHKMLTSSYLARRPQLRAIVLLFLHTGLRISDVIHLRREAVVGSTLMLRTRKRGTVVRLQLHDEALAALNKLPPNGSPYFFATAAGRPILSLDKHLRRLWNHCGIVGGHAHRFRDTFAVKILEAGGSLYDVAKLLGISHRTAELYYTPWVKELQERGARLLREINYKAKTAAP